MAGTRLRCRKGPNVCSSSGPEVVVDLGLACLYNHAFWVSVQYCTLLPAVQVETQTVIMWQCPQNDVDRARS
jgi:hypothetical protein